jgi:hypothetical protein
LFARLRRGGSLTESILIIFDSDKWDNNDEYDDVANEIIKFIKEQKYEYFLIQNKSYYFGCTETHTIIMVNRNDFAGIAETLELYIKDIVYDLIPNELDEDE